MCFSHINGLNSLIEVYVPSGRQPSWTLSALFQCVFESLFELGRWWLWGKTGMAHQTDAGVSGLHESSSESLTNTKANSKTNGSLTSALSYQGGRGELVPLESEPGDNQWGSRKKRDLPGQWVATECQSLEERWDPDCVLMNIYKDIINITSIQIILPLIPIQTDGLQWSRGWWS